MHFLKTNYFFFLRQYNRKKKPVPGALAEEDLDTVEIPPDIIQPVLSAPLPSTSTLSTSSPAAAAAALPVPALNGEPALAAGPSSAADHPPEGEEMEMLEEEDEAAAAAATATTAAAATTPAAEKKKVPSPKLKINTPKKPKPNK